MRYLRYLLMLVLVSFAVLRLKPLINDISLFLKLVENINYSWFILAVFCIFGQYFGDGWLSQILLKIAGVSIKLKDNMKIAVMDVFASHMLPLGDAGAIVTSYYFYKKIGVESHAVVFLTIFWAIFTNLTMFTLLVLSIIFLPKLENFPFHISKLTQIILTTLALVCPILIILRKKLWKLANRFISKYPWFSQFAKDIAKTASYRKIIFKNKTLLLQALLASFIYFAGNIASLTFAFLAFGHPPAISVIAFAYLISLIASFITLAPAGIGSAEAALVLVFQQFKVEPALALAASLTFRFITSWLPVPFGFLAYKNMVKYPRKG